MKFDTKKCISVGLEKYDIVVLNKCKVTVFE